MKKVFEILYNEKINDIQDVEKLDKNIKQVYTILDSVKPNENKLKKMVYTTKKLKIKSNEPIAFTIYAKDIKNSKVKYLKKIKKIRFDKRPKKVQIIVTDYTEKAQDDIKDLIKAIKIQSLSDTEMKYDYIYENVCNYLDNKFICDNICEFKENKCIAKRDYNLTCGCCRHYKSLFSNKLIQCEYLVNNRCTTKCISCKLYTCDFLIKYKGIRFRINDIFLLKHFFNPIQKLIIFSSFFKTREYIMRKLIMYTIKRKKADY